MGHYAQLISYQTHLLLMITNVLLAMYFAAVKFATIKLDIQFLVWPTYQNNVVGQLMNLNLDKIDTHSLNGFTNYVKLFLLQTYQDTCTVPNCYICSLSNTLNT